MAQHHFLVSGANGFLGQHLVQNLSQQRDVEITALIRPGRKSEKFSGNSRIIWIEIDVTDQSAVQECLLERSPTHVINATSYGVQPDETDFSQSVSVNVLGTFNLLIASAGCSARRFIQIGSFFEYGNQKNLLKEDTPLRPTSVYAATKAAAGLLVNDKLLTGPMDTVITRVFHLWGPEEPPNRLTQQVIRACQTNTSLSLTSGLQEKDFTYVKDAARWIIALARHDDALPYNVFNIAGDMRCTVRAFATAIASRFDLKDILRFGEISRPLDEPDNGMADTTRLVSVIGTLSPTPFEQALTETTNL